MACVSQPHPLLALQRHADALARSGDLAGARELLGDVVADVRARLGEDDPGVLATALQLARLHRQADDPTAARRVLEEAYAGGQWRLGDADPVMLEISFELGLVAGELGNRHEARKALGRVAETGAAVLGPDHWTVRQARDYLDSHPFAVRDEQTTGPAGAAGRPIPVQHAPRHGGPEPDNAGPRNNAAHRTAEPAGYPGETATGTPPPTRFPPEPDTTRARNNAAHGTAEPAGHGGGTAAGVPGGPDLDGTAGAPIRHGPGGRGAEPGTGAENTIVTGGVVGSGEGSLARGAPSTGEPGDAAGPGSHGTGRSPYQTRGSVMVAAIAACLAAIIAMIALVFALGSRQSAGRQSNTKDNVPTLAGRPPTGVRLDDHGASIRLSWRDPAAGRTTFVVTGGHPGDLLKPMGQTGPGETVYELHGLSTRLDYCFAVVAVYDASTFASSGQACTRRVHPRASQ